MPGYKCLLCHDLHMSQLAFHLGGGVKSAVSVFVILRKDLK